MAHRCGWPATPSDARPRARGRPSPPSATGNRQLTTAARMPWRPRISWSRIDVDELGQLGLHRIGCGSTRSGGRVLVGVQQVALGADDAAEAGHHLFADGVERRVGHLGEQLLEVVVQHPRPGREHRDDRGVGAHRAERPAPVRAIGATSRLELLVGVAEDLLAGDDAVVRHLDGSPPGSSSREQAVVQPVLVGMLGGQLGLDLLVGMMRPWRCRPGTSGRAAGGRCTTVAGGMVEYAGSDAITTRPSSVTQIRDGRRPLRSSTAPTTVPSVKHTEAGPSHGSISESGTGRTPGPPGPSSLRSPRLRDHHQHRVGDGRPPRCSSLEQHLVENARCRAPGVQTGRCGPGRCGRRQSVWMSASRPASSSGCPDGVDLAAVGHPAERAGQRPRRETCWWRTASARCQAALQRAVRAGRVERPSCGW